LALLALRCTDRATTRLPSDPRDVVLGVSLEIACGLVFLAQRSLVLVPLVYPLFDEALLRSFPASADFASRACSGWAAKLATGLWIWNALAAAFAGVLVSARTPLGAARILGPLAVGAAGCTFVYASTEVKFIVFDLSFALLGVAAFVAWMRRTRS
jgi:hypothetical protein